MSDPSLAAQIADSAIPARSVRVPWRAWLTWLVFVHAIVLAVFWRNTPIAPQGRDAPAPVFSEARALGTLDHLANQIGLRLAGTENAERAAEYLASQLRAIPGVEVDVQRVADAHHLHGTNVPWPVIKYRVTNVVARIPGRKREAVLLDAHFDTLGDSPGAGDDGIGVVSIVEAARALAAGPTLEHSVIILCNGGEEYGLYGADGFIRKHPLARDVRAYLYIDGGPGGAATLLYAGPGTPGLVQAYAASAPRPQADSAYLDLMDSGVLNHEGDHRPFRDQGVPGLLFATIGDLWAGHTSLDRFDRVERGAIQHVGQTVLEAARLLAAGPLPAKIEPERSVYFDVFGALVVHYRTSSALWLGLVGAALALAAVWLARRRGLVAWGGVARAFFAAAVSGVAALFAGVGVGLLLAYVIQRPFGWYATPWAAYAAFVIPTAAVFALVQARLRPPGREPLWETWSACVLGWAFLLLWASLAHARSSHIALAWVLGLSCGLIAALRWPAQRGSILLAACAPGLYTIAHLGPMLRTMLAQAGLQPLPIAADPVLGALCGATVAAAGAAIALPVQAHGLGRAAHRVLVGAAAAGVLICAVMPPFTAERPRRVLVTQAEANGRSAFLFRARDALALEPALAGIAGVRPARADWPSFEAYEPTPTHEVDGPTPGFAPPSIEVLSRSEHADGTRTVELRLRSQTPNLRVYVDAGRVQSWSVHPEVAEPPFAGGRATIYFQGVDPDGEPLSLRLRGSAPVGIEVVASTFEPSAELRQLAAALPAWAVPVPLCARSVKERL